MAEKQTKYIFVTGGVVSGLGKGITAASLGRLLKCRQKLRVPRGRGRIQISCPRCGTQFIKKS